jgi:hypothetical protein
VDGFPEAGRVLRFVSVFLGDAGRLSGRGLAANRGGEKTHVRQ